MLTKSSVLVPLILVISSLPAQSATVEDFCFKLRPSQHDVSPRRSPELRFRVGENGNMEKISGKDFYYQSDEFDLDESELFSKGICVSLGEKTLCDLNFQGYSKDGTSEADEYYSLVTLSFQQFGSELFGTALEQPIDQSTDNKEVYGYVLERCSLSLS